MPPLRIALLAPLRISDRGCASRYVASLIPILEQLGHTVTLFTEDTAGPQRALEALVAHALPSTRDAVFGRRFSAYPYFTSSDVVLSFGFSGIGVRHPRHLRVLTESSELLKGNLPPLEHGLKGACRALEAALLRKLEWAASQGRPALPCSNSMRDELRAIGLPVRENPICPPVPAPRELPPRRVAKAAAGLKRSGPCVLYAGRWSRSDGADRLSRIASALPSHWELILAVHNPEAVPDAVRARSAMTGTVAPEAMSLFYRAADVTLRPSRLDGARQCLAESMLCNTPVVTAATGPGRDMRDHPGLKACVVDDPDNPQAWLQALSHLEGRTEYEAAAIQGRAFAEAQYGIPAVSLRWAALLFDLIQEKPLSKP